METINRQTKTSIYFHIAYVIATPCILDKKKTIEFQKTLLDNGLDFSQTTVHAKGFTLVRAAPSNLQVKLEAPAPQLSGIQVISSPPSYDLDMFIRDADAATSAYQQTFGAEHYQLIRTTAKIQHLYSCRTHAFKYLWETRLGQSPQDFQSLGKPPVAGGGLRLVIPPHTIPGREPCSIEIRLESYFREQNKIFIETTFTWPKPKLIQKDEKFDPAQHLNPIEEYAANEIWEFLTQNKNA